MKCKITLEEGEEATIDTVKTMMRSMTIHISKVAIIKLTKDEAITRKNLKMNTKMTSITGRDSQKEETRTIKMTMVIATGLKKNSKDTISSNLTNNIALSNHEEMTTVKSLTKE